MRKEMRRIATLGLQGSSPPPRDVPSTIPAPPPTEGEKPHANSVYGKVAAPVPEFEHTTVINSLQGFLVLHVNPVGGGPPQFLGTPFKEKGDAYAGAEAEGEARKIPFIPREKALVPITLEVAKKAVRLEEPISLALLDDISSAPIKPRACDMPESYKDADSPLCTFPLGHEGMHSWDMDLNRPEDS